MDATTYGKRSFMCGAAIGAPQPAASFRLPRSYCDPNPVGSAHPCGSLQSDLFIYFRDRVCGVNCFPLLCCLPVQRGNVAFDLDCLCGKVCGLVPPDVLPRCCCLPLCEVLEDPLWREKFFAYVAVMGCRMVFGEVVSVVKLP